MNEKKRASKLAFTIFLFILLVSLSVQLSTAICWKDPEGGCYTSDVRASDSDTPIEAKVCKATFRNQVEEFACVPQDQQLDYCCSINGEGVGLFGFTTDEGGATALRNRFSRIPKITCFPGLLSGSGACTPSIRTSYVNLGQKREYGANARVGELISCQADEVACDLHNLQKLSCCSVLPPLKVDFEHKEYKQVDNPRAIRELEEDAFQIMVNEFSPDHRSVTSPGSLKLCKKNQAICAINKHEGISCCDVDGVKVNREQNNIFLITSEMRGENAFCYENEVICGLEVSYTFTYRNERGVLDLTDTESEVTGTQCCRVFECQPEPNCELPRQDNDCNNLIDGLDPVCADTDSDRVKDAGDQCANTPADERADATGCSLSQKDSDNDGVKDNLDLCPGTPAGTPVERDGCPPAIADTRQACDARREAGLIWLGSDQGGACCGDGDGEYFILQNEACVGSIPLQSGYSGGGFGRHFLSDLRSPGVKGNAEAFLTVTERSQILGLGEIPPGGEDEEGPTNFIRILKHASHIPYLNQYVLEYIAEVDGSQDANTQLQINIMDDRRNQVYRKTVPGTNIFPNRQRTIQDTFELSQGNEIQISVRKSGAGTVKIGKLALYHLGDRQIFFTGEDFLFCRNPNAPGLLEGGFRAFERTEPQEGPLTNENNARSACAGALESGFVCDTDGQWRDKGALPHINKSLPSEAELRDVGITLAFNRADQPNVRQTGCCLPDYCWDGGQCVPASNADSMFGLREVQVNPADQEPRNLFVCDLDESGSANWIPGQRKFDQYLTTSSFCASEQCWFNGERQNPPSPSRCVESGEKNDQEGIFCGNGAWKTKLTALVESMIDVRDRNAETPNQFSLYCDDLSKVVLDPEGKTAFWDRKIDTIFTGKEKACILAYNHATWRPTPLAGFLLSQLFGGNQRNIIIGVLLDGDDRVTDEIASKNGPQQNFCGGAKQSLATNNFVGCAGPSRTSDFARLFFNKDLNAVIFSGYADIRVQIGGGG